MENVETEEFISRAEAVKAANEWVSEACMAPVMRVSRLFDKLAKVPAADVAEVVRCKDCAAWKRNVGIVDSPNGHCFEHDIDTNGQDFCSYGEYQTNTGGVTK